MKTFFQLARAPDEDVYSACVGRMRYPALTPGKNGRMEYTWSGWRKTREKAIEEAYCKAFGIDNAFQSAICQSRKAYEREYRHAEEYRNSGPSLWSPGYRLSPKRIVADYVPLSDPFWPHVVSLVSGDNWIRRKWLDGEWDIKPKHIEAKYVPLTIGDSLGMFEAELLAMPSVEEQMRNVRAEHTKRFGTRWECREGNWFGYLPIKRNRFDRRTELL